MRNFFACSVGDPGKDYDEENLERIIKNKAFILHQDAKQKGVYENINRGDILLLKYKNQFIGYGESEGVSTSDDEEWNLWAKVREWIFKDPGNPNEGVSTHGIGWSTNAGGQYGTVKELSQDFSLIKMKEINEESEIYNKILLEITTNKKSRQMQDLISLLKYKKQIILQGPPGTGKTFISKNIAELMIFDNISIDRKVQKNKLQKSGQFKLIQFHPAYSYEDFVRGITAKSNGTQIEYITENKLLAEFALEAQKNYEDSDKNNQQITLEKWIDAKFDDFISHIVTRLANSETIKLTAQRNIIAVEEKRFVYGIGEYLNFAEIKRLYQFNISSPEDLSGKSNFQKHVKWRLSYYLPVVNLFKAFIGNDKVPVSTEQKISIKNYLLIIDEINRANLPAVLGELIYALEYRDEPVDSMYELDGDRTLILPPNLYIIGTMNTADRSVGHIDYAIRRRFAYVDILPSKEPVHRLAQSIFKQVSEIFIKNYDALDWSDPKPERSDHLAADFRPEDVWVGHSYFIPLKTSEDEVKEELQMKLDYEIKPLLKEYLKDGLLLSSAEEKIELLHV